jgi:hypothetical protein
VTRRRPAPEQWQLDCTHLVTEEAFQGQPPKQGVLVQCAECRAPRKVISTTPISPSPFLINWAERSAKWQWRSDPDPLSPNFELEGRTPSLRRADVKEIAHELLSDPWFRAFLGVASSPGGQVVEQVVLERYMTPEDAKLLITAFGIAVKLAESAT